MKHHINLDAYNGRIWLGVDIRTNTKKHMYLKKTTCLEYDNYSSLNRQHEHEIVHINNEEDIHTSSKNYAANDCGHDSECLIILRYLHVSIRMRSQRLGGVSLHKK